jgi:triacylglycerol lipase
LLSDAYTMLRLQGLSRLNSEPPSSYLEHKAGKTPVILIPGILERWGMLRKIADTASTRGHDVYVVTQLGDNLYDIETSVNMVERIIDLNHLYYPFLIAHSYGGLIGQEILRHKKAFAMIAVATPFSGSDLAEQFPYAASIREATPKGRLLSASDISINHRIVSIFPETDNFIPNGCELTGAENISIQENGHHNILEHSDVIGWTIRKLKAWEEEKHKR